MVQKGFFYVTNVFELELANVRKLLVNTREQHGGQGTAKVLIINIISVNLGVSLRSDRSHNIRLHNPDGLMTNQFLLCVRVVQLSTPETFPQAPQSVELNFQRSF